MIPYLSLSDKWHTVENPSGPWTLKKKSGTDNNAFQISAMLRKSSEKLVPQPDAQQIAVQSAMRNGGNVVDSHGGTCTFGRYGSAVFQARQFQYCQNWILTNDVHFIQATYICDAMPDANELQDVSAMALSLRLVDAPPKDRE